MRIGLIAFLVVAVGLATWVFWPESTGKRIELRDAVIERPAPKRELPTAPLPAEEEPGVHKGVVRGPAGEAVVGAEVRIDARDPVRTNEQGRFEFARPERRKSVTIRVTHHAYLDVTEERDQSFDFTLELGLSVSGRVAFPDGSPVPGWGVWGSSPGKQGPREMSFMLTDDDGRFELTGLLPGRVAVWTADGGSDYATLNCEAGTTDLRFVVKCSLLRVSIYLPNGKPAVGASLNMGWGGNESAGLIGPNVREYPVTMEVKPGLDIDISVSHAGCRGIRRTIASWSTTPRLHDVRIDLERAGGASILLDIWKPGAIRPKAVIVEVVGTTRKEEFKQIGARMLRLDDFEPGPVVLKVYEPSQPFLAREFSAVATETEPRPTEVELPRGARVRVHCPDTQQFVALRPVDSKIQFMMMRHGEDLVSYADVPEGTYLLSGFKGGKPTREVTVHVKGTKEHKFDWPELTR